MASLGVRNDPLDKWSEVRAPTTNGRGEVVAVDSERYGGGGGG